MFGCCSRRRISTSRRTLATSLSNMSPTDIVFTATTSPFVFERAVYTLPHAPRPSTTLSSVS